MKYKKLKSFKFRVNLDGGTFVIKVPATCLNSAYRTLEKAESYHKDVFKYQEKGS